MGNIVSIRRFGVNIISAHHDSSGQRINHVVCVQQSPVLRMLRYRASICVPPARRMLICQLRRGTAATRGASFQLHGPVNFSPEAALEVSLCVTRWSDGLFGFFCNLYSSLSFCIVCL